MELKKSDQELTNWITTAGSNSTATVLVLLDQSQNSSGAPFSEYVDNVVRAAETRSGAKVTDITHFPSLGAFSVKANGSYIKALLEDGRVRSATKETGE